jgi:hypothetical protein
MLFNAVNENGPRGSQFCALQLVLVNYEHHAVASPYRMRFAVYVREGEERYEARNQVPEELRLRTLAVRAYDESAMMAGWELVEGRELEGAIDRLLALPRSTICTPTSLRLDVTQRG